jgi:hypothetical protein
MVIPRQIFFPSEFEKKKKKKKTGGTLLEGWG